ncbi:ABC transporter permease [Brevibacillus fluminis]|uniref:ABC transporter permease n=1 Tax=Brevibacillus fluminis TaxID=511487 RepID=A0A3M8CZF1_9BACL|nr:nickel transporter permease [Brevibacillus fluminis]RNB81206.1 ABC transporter permease [Brevibacillus fluminis]
MGYFLKTNKLALIGVVLIVILILFALLAPLIATYPQDVYEQMHLENKLLPPSFDHYFGTDEMGRDIFSRVLFGTRISFEIGVIAISLSILIGVPLGLIAGYFGGWIDEVIMRICDIFLSFPSLLLAIAIVALLGPSISNMMIAIALSWWPWYTRLIRSQAISVKERGFVEAAKSMGVSPFRIILRHVFPNSLSPVIVQASMDFGSIILTAASLSFLGLGAQAPTPEWGLMISIGRNFFLTSWWYVTIPGMFILLTVMAFNFLGDGLRDYLDPKIRDL